MTRIVGNDGEFSIATHFGKFNQFSLRMNPVVSDVTAFGDTWRQKKGGIAGGSLNASGVMSKDASSTKPNIANTSGVAQFVATGVAFTCTVASGCTLAGTVVASGLNITSNKTGDASVSIDGDTTGTITETWDET